MKRWQPVLSEHQVVKVCRLMLDLRLDQPTNPVAGDRLLGPRAVYTITESRPVDSRVWGNRWALTVRRIGSRGDQLPAMAGGAREWESVPYRRGEGPADVFDGPSVTTDPASCFSGDRDREAHS